MELKQFEENIGKFKIGQLFEIEGSSCNWYLVDVLLLKGFFCLVNKDLEFRKVHHSQIVSFDRLSHLPMEEIAYCEWLRLKTVSDCWTEGGYMIKLESGLSLDESKVIKEGSKIELDQVFNLNNKEKELIKKAEQPPTFKRKTIGTPFKLSEVEKNNIEYEEKLKEYSDKKSPEFIQDFMNDMDQYCNTNKQDNEPQPKPTKDNEQL